MTIVYDYVGAVNTVNLADNAVTDAKIAVHTSTKITITTKGQLNSQIMYKDATNVPSADAAYDLGSLAARFKDVFASGAYKMGATPLQIQEVDANTATLVNSVGARKTWLVSGIRASSLAQEDGTVLITLGSNQVGLNNRTATDIGGLVLNHQAGLSSKKSDASTFNILSFDAADHVNINAPSGKMVIFTGNKVWVQPITLTIGTSGTGSNAAVLELRSGSGADPQLQAFKNDVLQGNLYHDGTQWIFNDGANILTQVKKSSSIADGETALLVRRNVGGTLTVQQVSMGAIDSGGAGFRVLRVPN